MAAHLRVYPAVTEARESDASDTTIGVRFGDLLPLVALAQKRNYLWLQDFAEDEVRITADLYDVLRAFRCVRPSA